MLRQIFPAVALLGAALMTGCAQTGQIPPTALTVPASAAPGWRPFSADSPWNTRIPADAKIDPKSDVLVADLGVGGDLYVNMPEWSVMVKYFDSSKAPKRAVRALYPGRYGPGFEPGERVPLPADALPEDATPAQSNYFTLVDPVRNLAWDTRQLGKTLQGDWFAGFGAAVDLSGTGVSMPWMKAERSDLSAGARPSGIPLMAGLIRVEEVKAGRIDHALAFAYPLAQTGKFLPPASTALGAADAASERHLGLPMGARIQLNPDYDIDNTLLSPSAKVVARALQEYGAILVDEAGATVLFAESGPEQLAAWEGVLAPGDLQALFTAEFIALNFHVIDTGEPMAGIPRKVK
ncbi:MAG: hypothetical protein KJ833_03660 [Alphaproteobacteria bacterium]|uniref:hypothetical protein n=1 Tax=Hyphomonas sp. TaxID=87 RepID=UPI001D6A5C48|nr:hypothetical protein [Hyphomonas sp.]MBU3921574.1 hypothetical protein [Alphaproteobacteria bacterium]MBU4061296.1 hypothetical protein [Alphaproteobacteria bacterium]MBU4162549.1 hypothetical protein [Alphaproteobacteria bacterium]MBU4568042.1 hypothetical protein [Alphaproteobacteria bacterium]